MYVDIVYFSNIHIPLCHVYSVGNGVSPVDAQNFLFFGFLLIFMDNSSQKVVKRVFKSYLREVPANIE